MYSFFYRLEIDIVCLIFLVWVIVRTYTTRNSQLKNLLFLSVAYSLVTLLTLDFLWYFIDGHQGKILYILHITLRCIFKAQTGVLAYFWLTFTLSVLNKEKLLTRPLQILYAIPLAFFVLLSISSPWTHWIVKVDPFTNIYIHGPYHYLQSIITYPYYTFAGIIALVYALRSNKSDRLLNIAMSLTFSIFPLLGGVTLLFFPGVQVVWHALTLSLVTLYCNMQFLLISIDELTGLNNRRKFISYINSLDLENMEDQNLCICMMDLNRFKDINDIYGHQEGDKALCEAADILKNSFGVKNSFLARYGGDEFVAILYGTDKDAQLMQKKLQIAFINRNNSTDKSYKLSVSFGYATTFGKEHTTFQQLIHEADQALYMQKKLSRSSEAGTISL